MTNSLKWVDGIWGNKTCTWDGTYWNTQYDANDQMHFDANGVGYYEQYRSSVHYVIPVMSFDPNNLPSSVTKYNCIAFGTTDSVVPQGAYTWNGDNNRWENGLYFIVGSEGTYTLRWNGEIDYYSTTDPSAGWTAIGSGDGEAYSTMWDGTSAGTMSMAQGPCASCDQGPCTGSDAGPCTSCDQGQCTSCDQGPCTNTDFGPCTSTDSGACITCDQGPCTSCDQGSCSGDDHFGCVETDSYPCISCDQGQCTSCDQGPCSSTDVGLCTKCDQGACTGYDGTCSSCDQGPCTSCDQGPCTGSDTGPCVNGDQGPCISCDQSAGCTICDQGLCGTCDQGTCSSCDEGQCINGDQGPCTVCDESACVSDDGGTVAWTWTGAEDGSMDNVNNWSHTGAPVSTVPSAGESVTIPNGTTHNVASGTCAGNVTISDAACPIMGGTFTGSFQTAGYIYGTTTFTGAVTLDSGSNVAGGDFSGASSFADNGATYNIGGWSVAGTLDIGDRTLAADITLNSGATINDSTASSIYSGTLTINGNPIIHGGTWDSGQVFAGCYFTGNEVIGSSCSISNSVLTSGTFNCSVTGACGISGGYFDTSSVVNIASNAITGGEFHGTVQTDNNITGGTYLDSITWTSNAYIQNAIVSGAELIADNCVVTNNGGTTYFGTTFTKTGSGDFVGFIIPVPPTPPTSYLETTAAGTYASETSGTLSTVPCSMFLLAKIVDPSSGLIQWLLSSNQGSYGWNILMANGNIYFSISDTSELHITAPTDGLWHSYILTIDGDNNAIAYIDGAPAVTGTGGSITVANGWSLGYNIGAGYGANFGLSFANAGVLSRVLTSGEIASLSAGDSPASLTTNLFGIWKCNDNTGITVNDTSGNDYDMTITGTDYVWHSGEQPYITDGLLAYYPLNGNTVDYSGNAKNGTPIDITYTFGKLDKTAVFNGSTSYVAIPNMDTNVLTVAAWIKRTAVGVANESIVMSVAEGGWGFYLPDGITLALGHVGTSEIQSTLTIEDTNWHYAVVTYDGATARFYVDNVLDEQAYTTTFSSADVYSIGARMPHFDNQAYFNGKIEQVGIWNRALSLTEIAELWNNGSGQRLPLLATATGVYGVQSGSMGVGI